MSPKMRALIFLFLATFIWGLSYPIGRAALEHLTPWAYGGIRFMFGALSLVPLALRRGRQAAPASYSGNTSPYLWLWGGMLGGLCLSFGAVIQLYGMSQMPASQVGFITTLYVSLVPVLAFVTGYIPRPLIVIGLLIGLAGLYMLTGGETGSLGKSAILILVADVFWALQVIVTGQYAARVNTWLFSLAQAMTSTILVLGLAIAYDQMPTWAVFFQTLPLTLFGVLSVGVAYTCQAIAQKDMSSTSAALIFPLQSVIGAVAGIIFLGEALTQRMMLGASIIIFGTVVAQFARESTKVTPESKYWRPIWVARMTVGLVIGLASCGGLIWATL